MDAQERQQRHRDSVRKYRQSEKGKATRLRYSKDWWAKKGNERQRNRKRAFKAELVAEHGGECVLCGYSNHLAALDFDHIDPSSKVKGVASFITQCRFEDAREEAKKCRLLCANCHREQTFGVW